MPDLEALIAEREQASTWRYRQDTQLEQARRRRELAAAVKGWKLPQPYQPRTLRDAASLVEDVEWLVETGAPPETIPDRVGMTRDALQRRLYRMGRTDLANFLRHSRRAV
jgi:hypothetical protein